ncbi:hypothetical protein L4D06_06175 [Enterovibrio makurazakiensis]|uniref:hypothetical protein n=1 Tax=Enterovibrio makurazakiensis TaxID=2910232 RepID=UPI003D1FCF75
MDAEKTAAKANTNRITRSFINRFTAFPAFFKLVTMYEVYELLAQNFSGEVYNFDHNGKQFLSNGLRWHFFANSVVSLHASSVV